MSRFTIKISFQELVETSATSSGEDYPLDGHKAVFKDDED